LIHVPTTLWALPLALLLTAGCDLEPDVGAAINARCSNADTNANATVSFSRDIAPLLSERCAICHYPAGENPIGVQLGGLDLSTYKSLVTGGIRSGGAILRSSTPCDSVIFQKVSPGPPFGSRMPLNGPPFLADVEINLIHDWIAEGGRDN